MMESPDRPVSPEASAKPVRQDSLVCLELKEIWDKLDPREVPDFRVHEVNLANLVKQDSRVRWDPRVAMASMVKRAAPDPLELLDRLDSPDPEDHPD